MHKHSPILLVCGLVAAVLLGGCGKNDAENTDTTPAAPPARPPKPGVPGLGAAKPGGAVAPSTAKGSKVATAKPGAGKADGAADPFSPGTGRPGAKKSGATPAQARPGVPGVPGSTPVPGQPGAVGTQVASAMTIPKSKRDPFLVTWTKIPPPPYVFNDPNIQPLRVASADVEVPPVGDVAVREVADRRVSGIMSGDGVFAILESPGDLPEIVKPGSQTKDGYRVVSISADSLKLQRKDGNIIRTQIVPLTDQAIGGQQMTGGMFGAGQRGGMPGSGGTPGSGGPRPGRPGRPGAGAGGGRFGGGAGGGGSAGGD
jgi:hypothetical protein